MPTRGIGPLQPLLNEVVEPAGPVDGLTTWPPSSLERENTIDFASATQAGL
jgi:hypothetical protein